MIRRLSDLTISIIDILRRLEGVFLRMNDDVFLRFDDGCHVGEHGCEIGERGFDALEFVVACAHVAEDGRGLAGAVGFELWLDVSFGISSV